MSAHRCEACGREAQATERHHLAGVHNIASAWISVHRRPCHEILTEAQRVSGVVLHRLAARGPIDRAYAMIVGFAGWIGLATRSGASFHRNLRDVGQLLAALRAQENGGDHGCRFGPDPIRADRRESTWRGRRVRPVVEETLFLQAFARQLQAALSELGVDLGQTTIGRYLHRIESQPADYANCWVQMDAQTVSADAKTIRGAVRTLTCATRGLITVQEACEAVRPIRTVIERWLGSYE